MWVVLNANMYEGAARKIYDRFCQSARGEGLLTDEGHDPFLVIRHPGKQKVIRRLFREGKDRWEILRQTDDKVAFIGTLPYMGPALRHHLARNLGIDTVKPDRHLLRLADRFGFETPLALCQAIQKDLELPGMKPERLGTIDVVLWRYCNLGGDCHGR